MVQRPAKLAHERLVGVEMSSFVGIVRQKSWHLRLYSWTPVLTAAQVRHVRHATDACSKDEPNHGPPSRGQSDDRLPRSKRVVELAARLFEARGSPFFVRADHEDVTGATLEQMGGAGRKYLNLKWRNTLR